MPDGGFLDNLKLPFSGGLVKPPPFITLPEPEIAGAKVTPPTPPISNPFTTPPRDIPVSDFVTPIEPSPIGRGAIDPTPESIKQGLVDVGFNEEDAQIILGQAGARRMSPERIDELLKLRYPPNYAKGPAGQKEVARVKERMRTILSDPRLKDEYTRGLEAIYAYIHPGSDPNISGEYHPVDKTISIYDTARKTLNLDPYTVQGTAGHEIGHHLAEWAVGDTVSPDGWALTMQLDVDKGARPFVTYYPADKKVRKEGSGISEDFAESARLYFSAEPAERKDFRQRFPARAKVMDAITFALVYPEKEMLRLGVQAPEMLEDDADFPVELFQDMNIGRAAMAKALLEQEIAARRSVAQKDPTAGSDLDELKAMRQSPDWDEVLRGFNERVTNPEILEALSAADLRSSQWSNKMQTPSDVRAGEPAPRELLELDIKALDAGLERARTGFQDPDSPEHQAANARSEAAYNDLAGYWNAQRQPDSRFQDQPMGGGAVDQYLPLIQAAAKRHGLDWTLLAGLVDFESAGDATAYRKDTGATGLGQVLASSHMPGRPSKEKLMDPAFNLDYAASMIAAGIAQYGSEEKSLAAYLGAIDKKGNITGAKDANGTGANKYISEVRRRQGGYAGKPVTDSSAAASRRWPIEGYDPTNTRITTKYGGAQTITAGMDPNAFASKPKGADGRPINTGVDLAVKEGTGVINPDDGKVVDVRTVGGNHGGYGNTIKIQYGDGTFVRFSHLQNAPEYKVGQAVKAGARLGTVGSTGNATGPHLDLEAQDASGNYFDALQWVAGKGTPSSGAAGGMYAPRASFKAPFTYNPADQEQVDLGWSAAELLAGLDEDPEFAPVPTPRTLNSRSNKMASPTTQMPNIPLTGPDSATLQAIFTMMYTISQQAYNNLNQAGKAPQMVWDPQAFDDGTGNPVGGFVPSGGTTDTLAAINQAVTNNRSQITALAALAGQSGRVPVVEMGDDGYIYQLFGDDGKPVYQESLESRQGRLVAGQSVGYVSKDLLAPQAAPQGTMRRIGGGPTQQAPQQQQPAQNQPAQQQTEQQATDRFMPNAGQPQVNSQGGNLTNPATGGTPWEGQPIYSSNETGMQYPSGQGQGSAYSLNPANMSAPNAASDGQTFGSQPKDVIDMFVNVHGAQGAEDAWLREHNQAIGGGGAGGGGSLEQQLSQGAVESSNTGDSLQERIRRRIETGIVPTDMLTEQGATGSGEANSIVNAPIATIGDLAARNSTDPKVQAALAAQQGQFGQGAVASPGNTYAASNSANRQAPGESTPRARGAAVNEAGTTGMPQGQGWIQRAGSPGYAVDIRPEYSQALRNPRIAPGYIEGSGTYNQYPLDKPGLFGSVPGSGSSETVNLRYGLGGTGDPTTGLEVQTPEDWVQGAPLWNTTHRSNWGNGDRATEGLDYIATLFMRSDTPSGINTAAWSAPKPFWDGFAAQIAYGRIQPTARGWALLKQRGYTPQGIGGAAVQQAASVGVQ